MLNPFPDLLAFGLVAPLMVRLITGAIFLEFGWKNLTKNRQKKAGLFDLIGLHPGIRYGLFFSSLELIIGVLFVIGLFTQVAALIAALISLTSCLLKRKYPERFGNTLLFFCLLFFVSLSLLFSGAGFWAFDIPL